MSSAQLRILVCGDRNWSDASAIMRELEKYASANPVVIHGGARGADSLAGDTAYRLGLQTEVFIADWQSYGRAAGPIRNTQMLDKGEPDLVLAFHGDLNRSRGTRNMVEQAKRRGIPVSVFAS